MPFCLTAYMELGLMPLFGGTVPFSLALLLAASRRSLLNGSRTETQDFGTT